MATVKLNDNLNKEILLGARSLFDGRLAASAVLPAEFTTENVYNIWLDQTPGLRDDIKIGVKHGWLCQVAQVTLLSLNGQSLNSLVCMESKPGVWVSHTLARGYGSGLKLHGERASELLALWLDWKENRDLVVGQRDAFANQVKNLLGRHQTLKQALAEWPALWDFVPQEFKNKHNEEKARVAAAKAEPQSKPTIDLDVLNGAVVTAKILKGGFGS